MTPQQNPNPQPDQSLAWLVRVVRRSKPDADAEPDLAGSLETAWSKAAAFCGWSHEQLAQEVARQWGLRSEALPDKLSDDAQKWTSTPIARQYGAVMLRREPDHLVVAVADPSAPDMVQRLRFVSGVPIELVVAPPAELRRLRGEPASPATPVDADSLEDEQRVSDGAGEFHVEDDSSDSAVVRLCNMMLRQAMQHGASDIHVQPMGGSAQVRMRIDGLLRRSGRMPLPVMARLISRVKAVAGMDPTDRMRPQDGHARAISGTKTQDLRIATLPMIGGEKMVIRLLGGQSVLRLSNMKLSDGEYQAMRNLIDSSMGLVLCAGPTGSGKTTTLYSALSEKNTPDLNIVTVEDPVEIRLPRAAQTEVNPKAGLDFARALRSVVRQDPDIVLIGEIRDPETASIALQAAITGRLVFASIHANDAVTVLPRLTELGAERGLTAEAVRGTVAQRLVRAICPDCAQLARAPWTLTETWLQAHARLDLGRTLRAVGCPSCGGTGYRGRCVIVQVLTNTPELSRLMSQGAPLSDVRAQARHDGMRFLSESALERVQRGQTTVAEVLRVMGSDFWREASTVFDAEPPPAMTEDESDADGSDEEDRGAVLVFSKDEDRGRRIAGWLKEQKWAVVAAGTEADVRQAMEHDSDFALAVIDLDGVDETRARVLLAMRASLAGVAVPLLVFLANRPGMEKHFVKQPGVLVEPRPATAEQLQGQVSRALLY